MVLKVTKVDVVGTSGENARPVSGDVWFSDGKSYGWMRLPDGALRFYTYRKTHQGTASSIVGFSSPTRAKLLGAHLDL